MFPVYPPHPNTPPAKVVPCRSGPKSCALQRIRGIPPQAGHTDWTCNVTEVGKLCEKRGRTEPCGVAGPQGNLLQNLHRPPPHTELLVWYGDEYGKALGIKWGTVSKSNAPALGNQEYVCCVIFTSLLSYY
ncbi:hypothetical protein FKM82_028376 [Ascaphus truei]